MPTAHRFLSVLGAVAAVMALSSCGVTPTSAVDGPAPPEVTAALEKTLTAVTRESAEVLHQELKDAPVWSNANACITSADDPGVTVVLDWGIGIDDQITIEELNAVAPAMGGTDVVVIDTREGSRGFRRVSFTVIRDGTEVRMMVALNATGEYMSSAQTACV